MSYNNDGERRNFTKKKNFNGNRTNNNFQKKNNDEYAAKKAEIIAKQSKSLDVIEAVVNYIDSKFYGGLAEGEERTTKLKMSDIITVIKEQHPDFDDVTIKSASQLNYIILELAMARMNKYINTPDQTSRINIRVLYAVERLSTVFKKELSERINNIINSSEIFAMIESEAGEIEETDAENSEE